LDDLIQLLIINTANLWTDQRNSPVSVQLYRQVDLDAHLFSLVELALDPVDVGFI
jgi:hypothetical protein